MEGSRGGRGRCSAHSAGNTEESRINQVSTATFRALVAQAPDLESQKHVIEFRCSRAHFLLVIDKAAWPVIGNGIIILAHVGQHAQEAFPFRRGGFGERVLLGGQQQRNDQTAVLFDVALTQAAAGQLGFEIWRQPALGQRAAQSPYVMRCDQVQQSWLRHCHRRHRPDLVGGTILYYTAPPAFHTSTTLRRKRMNENSNLASGLSSPLACIFPSAAKPQPNGYSHETAEAR